MPRICYVPRSFSGSSADIINAANRIMAAYIEQGYKLTLRQLYYRFVASGLMENTFRNYKKLGSIVNDARLAGYIDWDWIEDRTRNLEGLSHWDDPAHIIDNAARGYNVDKWENQDVYVEVWIEKDALAGVFERVCNEHDVPFLSCRGYTSQSEMWGASQRLIATGKDCVILHFGDHDPSGIDMTRDIQERLEIFEASVEVRRIALNMDQIIQYDPPPNPVKTTDSRCEGYISLYGHESWELDALEPTVLAALVAAELDQLRDQDVWDEDVLREQRDRAALSKAARHWDRIERTLSKLE